MRTDLINKLALKLQKEGFENPVGRQAWGRLAEELYPEIKKKAEGYARSKSEECRIDTDTLLSIGLYEGVKRALNSWDIEKGDFAARLLYMLPMVFLDHIRTEVLRDKRKSLTTATSLSTPIDGENTTLEDVLVDTSANVKKLLIPSTVYEIFTMYEKAYGKERSDLAKIIFTYADKLDLRNKAICSFFGVADYNPTIRKRVERAKKHFQEFSVKNKDVLFL
ncbi:hypothetical protein GNF82_13980 [Clostridium perfringens]